MPTNNKCPYIYGKGSKMGNECGKGCVNKFCSRHMPRQNTNENKKDDETAEIQSLISTVDLEDESTQKSQSVKSSKKQEIITSENNDDILITKYFVYDCIRDFFRDYNDINSVLGNNKPTTSSSSNMTSILAMAGIGCLPILLKNISGLNIQDALFKQASNNATCDSSRLYGQFEEIRNNAEQERTKDANQTKISVSNDGENQKTPNICDKSFRVI